MYEWRKGLADAASRVRPTGVGEYIRLRGVSRLANAHARIGAVVVDVGGGPGLLMPRLRRDLRASYTVIDSVPSGLGRRLGGDIFDLPIPDGSADVLVCSDVLEHVEDDRALVRHLVTKLAAGGLLVIHVPALRESPLPGFEVARARAEANDLQPHPHVRDGYTPLALAEMLAEASPQASQAAVRTSFTSGQTLVADIDWLLWNRRLTFLRPLTFALARLMRAEPGPSRYTAGLMGTVEVE